MKKQIIDKILMVLLISSIGAPAFADPVGKYMSDLNKSIVKINAQFPLTRLAIEYPISLAIFGGAMLGGTVAFFTDKLAKYINNDKDSSYKAFAYGALGGILTGLVAVPIAHSIFSYGVKLGTVTGMLLSQAEQVHLNSL